MRCGAKERLPCHHIPLALCPCRSYGTTITTACNRCVAGRRYRCLVIILIAIMCLCPNEGRAGRVCGPALPNQLFFEALWQRLGIWVLHTRTDGHPPGHGRRRRDEGQGAEASGSRRMAHDLPFSKSTTLLASYVTVDYSTLLPSDKHTQEQPTTPLRSLIHKHSDDSCTISVGTSLS